MKLLISSLLVAVILADDDDAIDLIKNLFESKTESGDQEINWAFHPFIHIVENNPSRIQAYIEIEYSSHSPDTILRDVKKCQQACEASERCGAITYSIGKCYLRQLQCGQ